MPYDVVYLEGGKFGIYEQLGTKEKFWVKRGAEDWLLKFGRSGSGENWAEKAACELARALGIPCARYELAKFGDRPGVVSPTQSSRTVGGWYWATNCWRGSAADTTRRIAIRSAGIPYR